MAKKPASGPQSDKVQAAVEATARRSKGKKGKNMTAYYAVIGSFVAVVLIGVFLSLSGGDGRRRGGSPSSGYVHDVSFSNENFSTHATPFFSKWTYDDVKWGMDGIVLQGQNFVGMAGAIQRCDDEEGVEGGALPPRYDVREAYPQCSAKIYDSGNCSSSYAIAAASSLSSRFCIADVGKYGGLQLSPQQIVACDKKSQGCQGGAVDSVWSYIQRRGLYPEECVPFAGAKKVACKTDCPESRKLKALSHCVMGGEKAIKREIYNRGPVVAPVHVKDDFLVYGKGIYSPTDHSVQQFSPNGEALIQAVTILGWGKSHGIPYWVVANSWGTEWGEAGVAHVAVDTIVRESYALVATPATEEAVKEAALKKEKEELARAEAKKERAARDERIREKQRQREEEARAAKEEEDDSDFETDDLDDGDDEAEMEEEVA